MLAFFVAFSAIVSGIITYISKQLLFNERLSNQDILLLTFIFGSVAALVFVAFYPIRLNGERK